MESVGIESVQSLVVSGLWPVNPSSNDQLLRACSSARYQRMIAETKMEVLRAVEGAGLPVNQVLAQLGIARLESRSVSTSPSAASLMDSVFEARSFLRSSRVCLCRRLFFFRSRSNLALSPCIPDTVPPLQALDPGCRAWFGPFRSLRCDLSVSWLLHHDR